jgi:hypothetical protein
VDDSVVIFGDVGNCEYASHEYYKYFINMIIRAEKYGIACSFTRCLESFNKWLEVIAMIPVGMKTPTVGRFDHNKGYVFDTENNRWNFRWQSKSDNSKEVAPRAGRRAFELGRGIHAVTSKQKSEWGSLGAGLSSGGRRAVELGVGVHAATSEQLAEWSRRVAPEQCVERGRKSAESLNHNSRQKYECRCGKVGKGPRMIHHIKNCREA